MDNENGGILNDFAKKKSNWVKMADYNNEIVCDIISYLETVNMQGDDTINYKLLLEGEEKDKILQCGSARLAKSIAALPDAGIGHRVKIKRTGEKFETKYEVILMEKSLEEAVRDNPAE